MSTLPLFIIKDDDDEEETPVMLAINDGDWIAPATEAAAAAPCECCANRDLGVYMVGCLRCYARNMARGVPRLEKTWDPERMGTLRRLIGEERAADAGSHYDRRAGNA